MPRALFLCSGTGSVGRPFRRAPGWEVVDVDRDGRFGAEVVADILTWDYRAAFQPGHFDVVWASPDCTQYSMARTTAKTPRDLEGADRLVARCLEIVRYLTPRLWFLENPDSGLLKGREVVAGLPFARVDYCMYGAPYRKRTRVWTNAEGLWTPRLCDRSHLVDGGRHAKTAQRRAGKLAGGARRADDECTLDELHALPGELCEEILRVCRAGLASRE
jgi:hypothetical protein